MKLRPPEELGSDPLVRRIWKSLGHIDCYVAGGYVRDHLLGRETVDLDLTVTGHVDALEEPVQRLASDLGTRAHLLGREPRCVWRVETADVKVELWPLGSLSLDDDILRRDFTCNALMWRLPDGPFIDRVGGFDDLASGRLAAISRGNLQDDPVRLLRAPRFLAEIETINLDHQTTQWIRGLSQRLAYAPKPRLGHELLRTIRADGAHRGLQAILDLDLFRSSAPVGTALDRDWLAHHLTASLRLATGDGHPVPDAVKIAGDGAKLALLFRGWGCPKAEAISEYAWPREDRIFGARAASMLESTRSTADRDAADRREMIFDLGESFPAVLAFAAVFDDPDSDEAHRWTRWWDQWQRNGASLVNPPPLLETDEIKAITGLDDGPQLGDTLRALRRVQARGEVRSAGGARRWLRESMSSEHSTESG